MKSLIPFVLLVQVAVVLGQFLYYPAGNSRYYVPRASFRYLNPGFRMSIPDFPGIESVTFDVKVDQRRTDRTPRWVTYQASRSYSKFRWSMRKENTELRDGDIIYYTCNVRRDGRLYKYENGKIRITDRSRSSEERYESTHYGSSEETRGRYRGMYYSNS